MRWVYNAEDGLIIQKIDQLYRESPGGDTGPGVHFFTFSKCTFKIYSFWRDAKSVNPGPMLLLRVRPGFALIAVCSSVIHRNIQLAMMRRLWW